MDQGPVVRSVKTLGFGTGDLPANRETLRQQCRDLTSKSTFAVRRDNRERVVWNTLYAVQMGGWIGGEETTSSFNLEKGNLLLLRCIGEKHSVMAGLAAGEGELFAVVGPGKGKDLVAFEVGNLFGRATAKRLRPEIVNAVIVDY